MLWKFFPSKALLIKLNEISSPASLSRVIYFLAKKQKSNILYFTCVVHAGKCLPPALPFLLPQSQGSDMDYIFSWTFLGFWICLIKLWQEIFPATIFWYVIYFNIYVIHSYMFATSNDSDDLFPFKSWIEFYLIESNNYRHYIHKEIYKISETTFYNTTDG